MTPLDRISNTLGGVELITDECNRLASVMEAGGIVSAFHLERLGKALRAAADGAHAAVEWLEEQKNG